MAYNFKSQMEAIEKVIPRLYYEIYVSIGEVGMAVYRTKEPIPFNDKTSGEKSVVKKGDVWGDPWDCGWFHITGEVPESAKGKKIVLYLDIHGELCIYDQNGVAVQALTSGSCLVPSKDLGCFGIRKRAYVVTENAKGGEKIDLWADAGCNFITSAGEKNRPDTGKIEFADICVCRDNVKALFYDFFVLYDLLQELPEESARYHRLRQAMFEAASQLYDYTDDEIAKASAILKVELDKKCGDTDF